jgi:hypothetical protein
MFTNDKRAYRHTTLDLVIESKDPWGYFRDKYVEVIQQGLNTWGFYKGMNTQGNLLLQPHVEQVVRLNNKLKKSKAHASLRWNSGLAILSGETVQAMYERDQKTMDRRISESLEL